MNKKHLPKAVLRTADQMREFNAAGGEAHGASDHGLAEVSKLRPKATTAGNVIEMTLKSDEAAGTPNMDRHPDAGLRRRKAIAIVEQCANYCAVGGAIPIPIANAAALTTLLVRMVKSLSELYEVPFERNRARAIVVGLMGGALPTGLATVAASTLTYLIPGYNLLGLAVSSVTSSAYARSIGQLFIEHFENGSTLIDLRSVVWR